MHGANGGGSFEANSPSSTDLAGSDSEGLLERFIREAAEDNTDDEAAVEIEDEDEDDEELTPDAVIQYIRSCNQRSADSVEGSL